MFRLTIARVARVPIVSQRAAFSTSLLARKEPAVGTPGSTLDKANRAAGDAALGAIETVEGVTESIKETAKPLTDKVSELAGDAKAETKKAGADAYTAAAKTAQDAKGEAYKAKVELDRKTGA